MLTKETDQAQRFKHGETPGRNGYRKGCRCESCRRGQRDYQRKYRAGKAGREAAAAMPEFELEPEVQEVSASIDWSAPAGPIELALSEELAALIGEPPFKKTLMMLAKYNAKVLDQLPRADRFDLISGVQSRLFNVFDRLRRVEATTGSVDSWDMSALMKEDE